VGGSSSGKSSPDSGGTTTPLPPSTRGILWARRKSVEEWMEEEMLKRVKKRSLKDKGDDRVDDWWK